MSHGSPHSRSGNELAARSRQRSRKHDIPPPRGLVDHPARLGLASIRSTREFSWLRRSAGSSMSRFRRIWPTWEQALVLDQAETVAPLASPRIESLQPCGSPKPGPLVDSVSYVSPIERLLPRCFRADGELGQLGPWLALRELAQDEVLEHHVRRDPGKKRRS
jgi:hypothetical protein